MDLILQRLTTGSNEATLGMLIYQDFPRWCTLEPPWRDNTRRVSCIPTGIYTAKRRYDSSRASVTWELQDVPNREHILCGHVGNSVKDTEGCILFGSKFAKHEGANYLLASKDAYRDFCATVGHLETLTILIR